MTTMCSSPGKKDACNLTTITQQSNNTNAFKQRDGSVETAKSAISKHSSNSDLLINKTPTLGERNRDEDHDNANKGPVNRSAIVTDTEEIRRLAVKMLPQQTQSSNTLSLAEVGQTHHDNLLQLVKTPMSSIAEN